MLGVADNSLLCSSRGVRVLPEPQLTYFFKDVHKEFKIRNPEKVGSLRVQVGPRV